MNTIKPKIFIGSSTPGLPVAEKVKTFLSDVGECIIWNEPNFWMPNKSTFENLLQVASFFDFGIFAATADDLTLTNERMVIEPRDNVILEMALFCGAMGRDKSFLMVERGIKLPSDFDGIYMPRFSKTDDESIRQCCAECSNRIEEHYRLGYLSLYPTTALAIAYYKNFIAGLVERLQESEAVEMDGLQYTDFKLKVVIPTDFKGNIREKAVLFYRRHALTENALKTKYRNYPAWFKFDPRQAPTAVLYDMPSTLTGIDDAIELIFQKSYAGKTRMQELIEQRELNNFKRVLQMQLDKSPFALAVVEIIDEF